MDRYKLKIAIYPQNTILIQHWGKKTYQENIGKTFSDINHTNVYLDQPPKAIQKKTKVNKWDIVKLTSFRTTKEANKKEPTEW